jgi:hypothetical protein
MKSLLLETCKKVSKRKKKNLSQKQYANLQKRYRNIITRGESELPVNGCLNPRINGEELKCIDLLKSA